MGYGPSIVIIGAGVGGLSMALELDKRGLTNWTIYEKASGVGGTWYVNRYPGCRCDVPALVYSHSQHQSPNWTQSHPPREELLRYWENLATSQNLMGRIKLLTEFKKAEWDPTHHEYSIGLHSIDEKEDFTVKAQILISACGVLARPQRMSLPGLDEFEGTLIHAAEWPEELDNDALKGKTVAVVGNGCSASQIVGTLAEDPEINIVNIARTKQWYAPNGSPKKNRDRNSIPFPESIRETWRRYPWILWALRWQVVIELDRRWKWFMEEEGATWRAQVESETREWLKKTVPPELYDKVATHDPWGSKRIIYHDNYLTALSKPQVKLIEGRLKSLRKNAIVLDEGQVVNADVVALAIGYDSEGIDLDITGTTDKTTNYTSKAQLKQYLGTTMPGIPNYFVLLGNNLGLNHMSITAVLEIQAEYIAKIIQGMRDYQLPQIEPKLEAALKWDNWMEKRLEKTTWQRVSNYWREGRTGRIYTHYPGSVLSLWWFFRWPVWKDFNGAEPIVRRQRLKRILFLLALAVAGYIGLGRSGLGQRLLEDGVKAAQSALHAGKAAVDVVKKNVTQIIS
ncbi:hypothetical protein Q8F55_007345 [Vanrija albida]|uniref:FAD/NAD(P)-binding domain-containing protein n=1 Tax=Vanrija albida TaxID=181172 RepID=A0ABR3PZP2_9TREE